jgi:hypothetical protein
MELRNHPIMICDGVRMWPPKWTQTHGPTNRPVTGEVGILDAVFPTKVLPPDRVYLITRMEDGNSYLGTLIFEKNESAKAVFNFLYNQIKKPLATIGGMDFPDQLPANN